MLDKWIEPPVKQPVPSFEEHGFERGGVLEHMAPLGVKPSAKLKQKIRNEMQRKSNGKFNAVQSIEEADNTPGTTPAPEPERSVSRQPDDAVVPQLPVNKDEEQDEDYVPNGVKATSRPPKPVPPPPINNGSASAGGSRRASTITPRGTPKTMAPLQIVAQTPRSRQEWESVIESAIRKANETGKTEIGLAVQLVYEESFTIPRLGYLLEVVSSQKSTRAEQREFQSHIKRAKKLLHKGGPGESTPSKPQPQPPVNATIVMPGTTSQMTIKAAPTIAAPIEFPPTSRPTSSAPPEKVPSPFTHRLKSPPKQTFTNGAVNSFTSINQSQRQPVFHSERKTEERETSDAQQKNEEELGSKQVQHSPSHERIRRSSTSSLSSLSSIDDATMAQGKKAARSLEKGPTAADIKSRLNINTGKGKGKGKGREANQNIDLSDLDQPSNRHSKRAREQAQEEAREELEEAYEAKRLKYHHDYQCSDEAQKQRDYIGSIPRSHYREDPSYQRRVRQIAEREESAELSNLRGSRPLRGGPTVTLKPAPVVGTFPSRPSSPGFPPLHARRSRLAAGLDDNGPSYRMSTPDLDVNGYNDERPAKRRKTTARTKTS